MSSSNIYKRVIHDTMEGRKFTIRIEESPEGGYTGQCMELPGAISEGDTIEELKTNMTEAIELVLESLEERAKEDRKLVIEISN